MDARVKQSGMDVAGRTEGEWFVKWKSAPRYLHKEDYVGHMEVEVAVVQRIVKDDRIKSWIIIAHYMRIQFLMKKEKHWLDENNTNEWM